MTDVEVKVGGWPLRQWGVVGDVQDTTMWRVGGYSGTTQASCSWGAPVDFSAPWLRRGQRFTISRNGVTIVDAPVAEIIPGDPWEIYCEGNGAQMEYVPVVEGVDVVTAADVANRSATPYFVTTAGASTTPPTGWSRPWFVRPGSATLGPDVSALVTGVYVLYATAVTSGTPTAVAITTPSVADGSLDSNLETKFGQRRRTIDATALGVITLAAAKTIASDRMTAGGRRMGWTGSVELSPGVLRSRSGAEADPLLVHAGDTLTLPGVTDQASAVAYTLGITVTLGEVTRYWSEGRAVVKPMGSADRDLASIFASIPKPADEAGVIVL